ncbi:HAD-IIA family hydrolase [Archaeoglobus veneficus]|uniref:HAD-superfamily hydrolase, subfamily IIA n=1 Tax=Archaeoglobus veneficus (strain DSM 11195 / SNP6) TaxID=693661 RepID=F2KMR6_ARCVS|nr:HAD-IIA family hydrolase [Archaeoglobus veneficus]AEA46090.1 HAD-superfamily hydrolase, subfamily IIA [Archaeoglobus veneficus SNP6]
MHPLLEKKGFILDIDGVIGRGETPIPEGVEAVKKLREFGKKLVFVSNNSTRSRTIMIDRFQRFGLDVHEDEMLLATFATARYLKREAGKAKIFTTGEKGLIEELELAGHEIVDYRDAEYLVVGSNRGINFEIMTKALRCCLAGTRYIATNPDRIFPAEDGPIPGTGMIIGSLYWMTGRMPDVVIGKPSKVIMEEALDILGLKADEVVVVGDQIDIDVKAGKAIGATTLLVLSGVTTKENLEQMIERHGEKPDYVLDHLGKLFD